MAELKRISVVVPVYNGEECLRELVQRLAVEFPRFCVEFEAVLVNDGSRDGSWELIRELANEFSWVRGVDFAGNAGQHNALLAGLRAASYEIVVTMDEDLEHPPGETGKLLARLDEGFDVVYGTPIERQHGLARETAAVVTKMAVGKALGGLSARYISSFRAIRTDLRHVFAGDRTPAPFVDELLSRATTRFSYVLVRHDPRVAGKSNYTTGKLIRHAFHLMTAFGFGGRPLASVYTRLWPQAGYVVRETVGYPARNGDNSTNVEVSARASR